MAFVSANDEHPTALSHEFLYKTTMMDRAAIEFKHARLFSSLSSGLRLRIFNKTTADFCFFLQSLNQQFDMRVEGFATSYGHHVLLSCSYGTPFLVLRYPSYPFISWDVLGVLEAWSRLAAVDPTSGTISCHQGTANCAVVWPNLLHHQLTVRR